MVKQVDSAHLDEEEEYDLCLLMSKLSLRRKTNRNRNRTPYSSEIRSIHPDASVRPIDDLPLDLFTRMARWSGGPLLEIFPANFIFDTNEVTGEQVKLPCYTTEQVAEKLRRSTSCGC